MSENPRTAQGATAGGNDESGSSDHSAEGEEGKDLLGLVLTGGERSRPLLTEALKQAGQDPFLRDPPAAGAPARIGIGCSGGGVRSASFNLGALQALRARGVLDAAEYLAAVSGGAYIAISHMIAADQSDAELFGDGKPPLYGHGSPEEDHLRRHTRYLAPDARGAIWFLLNLLVGFSVNALVLLAVLFPTARLLGWLVSGVQPGLQKKKSTGSSPGFLEHLIGWEWLVVALAAAAAGILVTAAYRVQARRRGKDPSRWRSVGLWLLVSVSSFAGSYTLWWVVHRERTSEPGRNELVGPLWMILMVISPLALGLLLILVTRTWDDLAKPGRRRAGLIDFSRQWSFNLFVLGTAALTVLFALPAGIVGLRRLRSVSLLNSINDLVPGPRLTIAALLAVSGSVVAALSAAYRFARGKGKLLVPTTAVLIGPTLIAILLIVFANTAAAFGIGDDPLLPWFLVGSVGLLLLIEAMLTTNLWSMHGFYRERLSSAYAIQRVHDEQLGMIAQEVNYNQPIGFSTITQHNELGRRMPSLIVCCALNVSGDLVPPGRHAASFTFEGGETGWSGSPLTGYVYTRDLEGEAGKRHLTLPALMAISGAALSPVMGKQGYPGSRMLFALLNVRLGVWIPNPLNLEQWMDDEEVRQEGNRLQRAWLWARGQWHRPGALHLLFELVGSLRIHRRYLYITDGGHWENLGLVELLRRRCTRIYCFDASGDALDTFNTIGEAMALARTELGVEFGEFDPEQIEPDEQGNLPDQSWVVVQYWFPDAPEEPGTLVFLKATVPNSAPWDVKAFADRDRRFPTHSTLIQLFDDEQFEAYRALGEASTLQALDELELTAS